MISRMIEGGVLGIYPAGQLCLLIARMFVCVCWGGGGGGVRLTPRRVAVLVYIQDDRGWVLIPSRSPVFADIATMSG